MRIFKQFLLENKSDSYEDLYSELYNDTNSFSVNKGQYVCDDLYQAKLAKQILSEFYENVQIEEDSPISVTYSHEEVEESLTEAKKQKHTKYKIFNFMPDPKGNMEHVNHALLGGQQKSATDGVQMAASADGSVGEAGVAMGESWEDTDEPTKCPDCGEDMKYVGGMKQYQRYKCYLCGKVWYQDRNDKLMDFEDTDFLSDKDRRELARERDRAEKDALASARKLVADREAEKNKGKNFLDDIDESIEKHDDLNPAIWDGDKLKPEVREKLLQIVDMFKQNLLEDEIDLDVKDVYLIGSNAGYNYTNDSDIDCHIMADFSSLSDEVDLVDKLYQARKSLWNDKYDPVINGFDVELYVEPYEGVIGESLKESGVVGGSWMGKDIDFNNLPTPDKRPSNSKLIGRSIKITDREEPRLYNKKLKITDVDDGSQTYINCDLPDGGYVRYNYDMDLGDKFVMSESLQLQEANSSGVYSIMNNTWVKVPNKNDAEVKDVSDQVAKLTSEANACQEIEQIDDFMDGVYKMRQEALLNGGEFSEGNLVFKELRNNGVLQDLKDRKVKLMNDLMSLGER